jgi:hypothetical protein
MIFSEIDRQGRISFLESNLPRSECVFAAIAAKPTCQF